MNKIYEFYRKHVVRNAEINAFNISTCELHKKTFLPFKNLCAGKKVVVCGAGPSLKDYIPIEGACHIAVNRAFLFDKVDFDFIFAQDWDGIKMVSEELKNYRPGRTVKLLGSSCGAVEAGKEISESYALSCDALRFNDDLFIYRNGYKSKCVKDIEYRALGTMPNVGMSVMQFALFLNPCEIYIVGCDMSGTHFAPGNQNDNQLKKEKVQYDDYWSKEQKDLLEKWMEIKEFAKINYPDTRIISVNPVGLKGVFEDLFQEKANSNNDI